MIGYVLLDPKEGWEFLQKKVNDPMQEFVVRYTGLRACSYLLALKPAVIAEKDLLHTYTSLLDQADMTDLAIDNLRKQQCWKLTERILAYHGKKSHDLPYIRRSILRYALHCPDPAAVRFIEQQRKINSDEFRNAEEWFKSDPKQR